MCVSTHDIWSGRDFLDIIILKSRTNWRKNKLDLKFKILSSKYIFNGYWKQNLKNKKKTFESYCIIWNRYSEYIKTDSNRSIQLKGHTMSLVTREIKIKTTKLLQFILIKRTTKTKTKQKNIYVWYKEVRPLVNYW